MEITKQVLEKLFAELKKQEIRQITLWFYGEGDDGNLDRIEWTPDGANLDETVEIVTTTEPVFNKATFLFEETETTDTISIKQMLEAIGYKLMDDSGVDWVNNEGGRGEIVFDVEQKMITASVDQRNYAFVNQHYDDFIVDEMQEGSLMTINL